ncbi:MAG: PAS domain S-box protein [Prolixibacteraceae bacterium]|nr:PAS domain S-box protein [Prolixibacteraceae bacterium]MBN2775560.1 PAS domain S-box protein [Prolixibacteraceae bacterium]
MDIHDFPVASFITSPDFEIIDSNALMQITFKCADNELKSNNLKTLFFDPEDFEKIKSRILKKQDISGEKVVLTNNDRIKITGILHFQILERNELRYLFTFQELIDPTDEYIHFLKDTTNSDITISLENYPDPVLITTYPGGKILNINKSFEKISGYNRGEVLGKTTIELDFYTDLLFREKIFNQLKESGKLDNFEIQFQVKNGEKIDTLLSTSFMKINNQECLLTVIRDFTEQKSAERNVRRSEERLKVLFENAPNGICLFQTDGKIIDANKTFEKITGIESATYINRNIFELNIIDKKQITRFNSILKEQTPVPKIIDFHKYDGTISITEIISHEIEINGKHLIMCIIRDITERKISEKKLIENEYKLNSFFKAAPIGIGIISNGVFTYVGKKLCIMTGYTEDELLGEKSSILYPNPEEFERVGNYLKEELKNYGLGAIETSFKSKDGNIIDVFLSTSPLDKNNLSKGIIFTVLDITKRKRSDFIKDIVYNISNAANLAPDISDFIKTIQAELAKKIEISNFYVAFYDKLTDTISTPYVIDEEDNITTWPAEKSLTGYVIKNHKPIFITKNEILELKETNEIDLIGTVSEAWIGVPLINGNEVIGALVVQDYKNQNAFSQEDFEMLQFISNQICISINRIKNEEKIRELQNNLQLQIEKMLVGLIQWDEFFHVVAWNPAAENIFGYSAEETHGKHILELIVADKNQPEINNIWNIIQNSNETIISINSNKTQTGKEILCEWHNTPLRNEDGTFLGILSMVQDVTNKVNSEQALKDSEEKYLNLINQSPDGIFIIDFNGNFLTANKFICDSLEIPENKINTKNIWDFVTEKYREQFETHLGNITRGEKTKELFEYEVILNDKSSMIIEIVAFPYFENEKFIAIQGIARDISYRRTTENELKIYQEKLEILVEERTTELKTQAIKLEESHKALSFLIDDVNESRRELEESHREIVKLSQALEQSPSSVVITDTDGNIEYVNNQFCAITGYSFDEVIGKNPRILNSGTHPEEFFKNLWNTISSGEVWHGEVCNLKKSGQKFWEYSSISSLRTKDNNISHFIAVKEDITSRIQTEQKLKEYTEELEIFNKAMVDRELKIIEMKEEVNSLYKELGRDIKYPPVWK